jgi:hypothetical protein
VRSVIPLGRPSMFKLNLIHFYHLGKEMRTLRSANHEPHRAFTTLVNKFVWLNKFMLETAEIPCAKTRDAVRALEMHNRRYRQRGV